MKAWLGQVLYEMGFWLEELSYRMMDKGIGWSTVCEQRNPGAAGNTAGNRESVEAPNMSAVSWDDLKRELDL